ncbi:MAG: sigma-70 family RNA polymerase sigma factor [Deltaproteobacteria bacterium]|nr:sigma-70 family RNA polymerase sigma factor [Deltaproteobacteria bacterium]
MLPTAAIDRTKLVTDHVAIARRIALKMARRCPQPVREDLVAAAMVGLTEAANRFDEGRAEAFLGFAARRIRGAVLDELRRGDMLPRRVRQTARKVAAAVHAIENAGEVATDGRVAEAMGVSVEHYRDELAQLRDVTVEPIDPVGGRPLQLAQDGQAPDELAMRRLQLQRVRAALAQLDKRDATLLALHYIEDFTLQQIGETLGISASRTCQLLGRAIERLRALVNPGDAAAA